jgi:aspartate/methionine/tyrosine aminotransferase
LQKNDTTNFSKRTDWDLSPNPIAVARQRLLASGAQLIDLTESNPTRCGFQYPKGLLEPLADPRGLRYTPDPKGVLSAREAVARLYRAKGVDIGPENILITASTSESYSFLLRLLCDPGDKIAVPLPSYPLFEHLASLNDAGLSRYRLEYDRRWNLDLESLEKSLTPETKALVVVHPNNPTGSALTAQESQRVTALCEERRIPLIADEVFAEYLFSEAPRSIGGKGLSFRLGGLSKFLALPQMKLGWIAVTGPGDLAREALAKLEMIADTYLSAATPQQLALPAWLAESGALQRQINERLRENRSWLAARLKGKDVELLEADGGWNAVLRSAGWKEEEEIALRLLEKERLAVYPGYFFEFESRGSFVISLLPEPALFQKGVAPLLSSGIC